VPGLEALGAASIEELAGVGGAFAMEARARIVAEDEESVLLRVPLPGTPEAGARFSALTALPRGAGTGFVFVRRYRSVQARSFFLARFTHPRSASLAVREWNLLCRLRSDGIATPEPMAVGAVAASGAWGEQRAALFARRSVLVTRELDRTLPAAEWLAEPRTLGERRIAVRALGTLLQRLHRSCVDLPKLAWKHVRLTESGGCGDSVTSALAVAGFARKKALEAAVTSVRGGRIRARPSKRALARTLRRLHEEAPPGRVLAESELVRVFLHATHGLGRAERRALLRQLARRGARSGSPVARSGERTTSEALE
jgi:hypothetical protein